MELRDLVRETRDLAAGALARTGHPFLLEEGRLQHETQKMDLPDTRRVAGTKEAAEDEMSMDLSRRRVYVIPLTEGRPGEVMIGRDEGCAVRIPLSSISKVHAILWTPAKGRWMLKDVGSTNGTYVEGQALTRDEPVHVGSGVVVRFGPEAKLIFLDGEAMEHLLRQLDPILRKQVGQDEANDRVTLGLREVFDEKQRLPAYLDEPDGDDGAGQATDRLDRAGLLARAGVVARPGGSKSKPVAESPLAVECSPFPAVGLVTGIPVTVGRVPGNDLILPHPQVSRMHVRFERKGGEVDVIDLGSANGVFVDGKRVKQEVRVAKGAKVLVGPYTVVVTETGAPRRAPRWTGRRAR